MKRGFTIIELLVASLLLGMLTTILTMLFNQSSVSWRTGTAMVADLDDVRENIAQVRSEADDLYLWNDQRGRLVSPWKFDGTLRDRACVMGGAKAQGEAIEKVTTSEKAAVDRASIASLTVGSAQNGNSQKQYIINVKSVGPDGEPDTWDDVWSFPDEFE